MLIDIHTLAELLYRTQPAVNTRATEDARANKAPTGLPPRTHWRDLQTEINAALIEYQKRKAA